MPSAGPATVTCISDNSNGDAVRENLEKTAIMEGKPLPVASKKPKSTYSLDTPYTDVQWPVVSADDQTEILDLLCSLLSPIGEHRSQNVALSKGRRARKRKRKDDSIIKGQCAAFSEGEFSDQTALTRPELHDHLTIGFNTTTRYLESLARTFRPSINEKSGPVTAIETSTRLSPDPANTKPLAAVFVPRFGQPPILYSHLPLLTKAASFAVPSSPPTRVIPLPEGAEDRLKTVLGIPRVGMVGLIDGAPKASSLIELIRQNVPELEVPWLQDAVKGAYLAVKISATQSTTPLNPKGETRTSTSTVAPFD